MVACLPRVNSKQKIYKNGGLIMAYTNGNMLKSVDWITICIYLVLVIMGWFSVCGASYDYGELDFLSFETRAGKQLVWISCSL